MPPLESHNTPYIQLTQYGRRIGDKVYWEISQSSGTPGDAHKAIAISGISISRRKLSKIFFVFLFFWHD